MSLEKLCGWEGGIYDAVWRFLLDLDPNEICDAREVQMMQLARYARFDYFKLEDADVLWIRAKLRVLERVLQLENETSRVTEND